MSREAANDAPTPEEQIKKLTTDLAAANKEIDSLSYAVSHDLRAPLRAIEGFADVVLEDYKEKLDAEGHRFLDIIKSSSVKASRMIDGILAYSRMGRHQITVTPVDLNDLVQHTITDLRDTFADRVVEFKVAPLPTVQGDFFLLREIWKNLLKNAVKFTRHQSVATIEISSHAENGCDIFVVRDNGIGFDMKYADKLFQLFQRLHSEAEFDGAGTGLAIAQRLVVRHGGKIWAEGKPHEGAVFSFALPK